MRRLIALLTFKANSQLPHALHILRQARHICRDAPHDPVAFHLIARSQVIHDQGIALGASWCALPFQGQGRATAIAGVICRQIAAVRHFGAGQNEAAGRCSRCSATPAAGLLGRSCPWRLQFSRIQFAICIAIQRGEFAACLRHGGRQSAAAAFRGKLTLHILGKFLSSDDSIAIHIHHAARDLRLRWTWCFRRRCGWILIGLHSFARTTLALRHAFALSSSSTRAFAAATTACIDFLHNALASVVKLKGIGAITFDAVGD